MVWLFIFIAFFSLKKKMEIILEKHVRRGKHLLIMLCDFFKNSNIESCFSMAISAYLPTGPLLSIQMNALS